MRDKILNLDEMDELAKVLANKYRTGGCIGLIGDLGTGKTTLTKKICEELHIEENIKSPTFTYVIGYDTGDVKVYHFDVYRLEDIDEFYAIGGDEYFQTGICIIEWGEKIEELLPKSYLKISFSRDFEDSDIRILNMECFGEYKLKEV